MKASIAILPGDGIGPEVTAQAAKVLNALAEGFGHRFNLKSALIGGAAMDGAGVPLPPPTLKLCLAADAVLLGAIGGPQWDDPSAALRPEQGLLQLRKALGVFANLRPVRVYPKLFFASPLKPEILSGVDMVVVRELTGGIYFGQKRRKTDFAEDICTYHVHEIERVTRVACDLALNRRRKLVSVDKANVLETSRLWRTTVDRIVRDEYPRLDVTHLLVDAAAMHLLKRPSDFDVVLTENMFGDILTDEASMLAGSLGLLPSASLGLSGPGLYEPIHGSAPDIAGLGVANPCGAILSAALLLRHSLGLDAEAAAVERAVLATLDDGLWTADLSTPSINTEAFGDAVCERLFDDNERIMTEALQLDCSALGA